MPGLIVQDLRKTYSDVTRELTVIESLSYEFPERGSVAIMGRSGIGKSTLLHLLGGLDRPTSGTVRFGDVNVAEFSDDQLSDFRGKEIGFIFQFHHLLPEFSALENVAIPLVIGGQSKSESQANAKEILTRVGLADRLQHRPGQLSGGEQQRVAIARALVAKPKFVLADEPTGNLDFETARTTQELLLGLNRDLGTTLIIVTHNPELARSLDLVLEMQPGGNLVPM